MYAGVIEKNEDENQIKIYTDKFFMYADDFIESNKIDKENIKENFLPLLHYVFNNTSTSFDISDVNVLDIYFNSFVNLCDKYNYIPSVDLFTSFINTYANKFSVMAYSNKANNELKEMYKKWIYICKTRLTNTLTQEKGSDVNRIFVAKAVYGMAETTAQAPEEIERHQTAEITSRYALNG